MKNIKGICVFVFTLVIVVSFSGYTHADNVEIKLGSGDGFKVLNSGGSPLMDILSNGKVGIGTSPNYKLDVSGDINFTGSLYQNGSTFSGSAWTTSGSDVYYNSGNVGIGTATPGSILHVEGSDTNGPEGILSVKNTNTSGSGGPAGYFESPGNTGYGVVTIKHTGTYSGISSSLTVINDNTAGGLARFESSGVSRMMITGDGNVGIGTTNPKKVLHIKTTGYNPVIIEGAAANNAQASTALDSLPNNTMLIGGPAGNYLYFYWKDSSGNKYMLNIAGSPL